ncbi:unnamed protein product [Owenia fusiformis]|uniref:Glycosyltransferase family 92 protein n=1 Tax=Owenia fusiformis TaxID=6347 RepID=A0A8J1U2T5_OWEFU|nr:unnamed protein product [Owenia fusiformis]
MLLRVDKTKRTLSNFLSKMKWILQYLNALRKSSKHLWNFQGFFIFAMTAMIQMILVHELQTGTTKEAELGDILYFWKKNLNVPYSLYAKSVIYKSVIQPDSSNVTICDGKSFDIHDTGKMTLRHIQPYQTLGDTNVHAISAFVDDRLFDAKVVRILGVGLKPGPGKRLYCQYDCKSGPVNKCNVPVNAVTLISGNHSDYLSNNERKSLMDVHLISCPIRQEDNPTDVTMATRACGYSHTLMKLHHFGFQGVVPPPYDVGVCVRPINESNYWRTDVDAQNFIMWVEYMKLLGADGIHLYTSNITEKNTKALKGYSNEKLKYLFKSEWKTVESKLERIVSDEAAMNDCIYKNMLKYKSILVTSINKWITMNGHFSNFKQMVRSDDFASKIKENGGYRITKDSPDSTDKTFPTNNAQSMIVKPSKVLALAANHFIPHLSNPRFNELSSGVISATHLSHFVQTPSFNKHRATLQKAVYKRIKLVHGV